MTNEEVAVRIENHEHEIGSLKHRMKSVEENQKALTELTTSVKELTIEQEYLKTDVVEIKTDVKAMLDKPAKRWEGLVDKLIFTAAGAVLAWLASGGPGL